MSSFRWRRLHVLAAVALVVLVAGTPVRAEQAIAPPQPDTLTYQKGCAVMRMLERYLGAEPFRRGIDRKSVV